MVGSVGVETKGGGVDEVSTEKSLGEILRICSAKGFRRGKYFVSATIHQPSKDGLPYGVGALTTFFLDSGADLSVLSDAHLVGVAKRKFEKPFAVEAFDGDARVTITHAVDVLLNFRPGVVAVSLFVCDVPTPILGLDIFRDLKLGVGFDTASGIFRIGWDMILTQSSAADSITEFQRRRGLGPTVYRYEYRQHLRRTSWIRLARAVEIHPWRVVSAFAMPDVVPDCDHSMFSLYDATDKVISNDGQRDIFIPSLVMDRYEYVNGGYNIPIANESCLPISLPKGMIIGEVVLHQTDLRTTGAECYDLVELLDELQERSGKTWKEEREEEEK